MKKYITISVLVYIGFVFLIFIDQRSFMYFPMTKERPDISKVIGMKWVDVTTEDGLELKSWFFPPLEGKPTIVLFHGNGHNISIRIPKAAPFIQEGYGMLLAEYRGYGGNPGKPSEEGFYKDARAQINWLAEKHNITGKDLILYGESIGSGVAVQMATEYEAKAIMMDVPFSSALDVAKYKFFFIPFLSKILKDQYLSDEKITGVHIPVFIGLAANDSVIPPRFGKKLFDAANEPKTLKIYEQAGHNDIHYHGLMQDMIAFINALDEKPKTNTILHSKHE